MISQSTEPLVGELLAVLDEHAELLELKRAQMQELSAVLMASDDSATEILLQRIEQVQRTETLLDARLASLRGALAGAFNCPAGEFKLARLIEELPADMGAAVETRRQRIVEGVQRFRRQHLETVMLLSECARVTTLLLDSILPAGEAVVTYGATGADHQWRPENGLLDMEQ